MPAFCKDVKFTTPDEIALFERMVTAGENRLNGRDIEAAAQIYKAQHGRLPAGLTEDALKALPNQVFSHEDRPALAESAEVTAARKTLEAAQRADVDRVEAALYRP